MDQGFGHGFFDLGWNFVRPWLVNPHYTCALCVAQLAIFVSNIVLNTLLFYLAFLYSFLHYDPKRPSGKLPRPDAPFLVKSSVKFFERHFEALKIFRFT